MCAQDFPHIDGALDEHERAARKAQAKRPLRHGKVLRLHGAHPGEQGSRGGEFLSSDMLAKEAQPGDFRRLHPRKTIQFTQERRANAGVFQRELNPTVRQH